MVGRPEDSAGPLQGPRREVESNVRHNLGPVLPNRDRKVGADDGLRRHERSQEFSSAPVGDKENNLRVGSPQAADLFHGTACQDDDMPRAGTKLVKRGLQGGVRVPLGHPGASGREPGPPSRNN